MKIAARRSSRAAALMGLVTLALLLPAGAWGNIQPPRPLPYHSPLLHPNWKGYSCKGVRPHSRRGIWVYGDTEADAQASAVQACNQNTLGGAPCVPGVCHACNNSNDYLCRINR